MIEKLLYESENKLNILVLFASTLFITLIIGIFSHYTFNHPYILIGLIALALSSPTIEHLSNQEKKIGFDISFSHFFDFFRQEIFVYSTIFFGFTAGLFTLFSLNLVGELTVFENLIASITGNFLTISDFLSILIGNLGVAFYTFLLSLIMFSGFLFILSWNAAILAYYLAFIANDKINLLIAIFPHLILEISGFILAGLAGNVLMYGIEYKKKKKMFFYYSLSLILLSIVFVTLGAFIETI